MKFEINVDIDGIEMKIENSKFNLSEIDEFLDSLMDARKELINLQNNAREHLYHLTGLEWLVGPEGTNWLGG